MARKEDDRSPPSVDKAVEFLRRRIADARANLRGGLQPVRRLAAECGLSRNTMLKAAHILRKQGELAVRHGSGLSVPGMPDAGRPAAVRIAGWKAVLARLETDALEGRYGAEKPMPSVKHLAAFYGVNYRTLRKSLDELQRRGLLVRKRRRLFVAGNKSRSSLTLLCVLDDSFYQNAWMGFYGVRTLSFFQNLENLCAERNIGVVRMFASEWEERRPALGDAVGVVLWISPGQNGIFHRTLPFLKGYTKPVLAVDWMGDFAPAEIAFMRNLFIFRHGDLAAGLLAGRFLLRRGHRSVAAFSFANEFWSRRRIDGVIEAFKSVSRENQVHPFMLDARLALAGREAFRDAESARWTSRLDSIKRAVRKVIRRETFAAQMDWMLYESLQHIWRSEFIEPVFSDALKNCGATAWVLDADTAACHNALPFLYSRGIKVPRQVSVIGFENTVLSFAHDLTSVDFRYGNLAGIILRICLQWGARRTPAEPRVQDIPVEMVERGSTRTA